MKKKLSWRDFSLQFEVSKAQEIEEVMDSQRDKFTFKASFRDPEADHITTEMEITILRKFLKNIPFEKVKSESMEYIELESSDIKKESSEEDQIGKSIPSDGLIAAPEDVDIELGDVRVCRHQEKRREKEVGDISKKESSSDIKPFMRGKREVQPPSAPTKDLVQAQGNNTSILGTPDRAKPVVIKKSLKLDETKPEPSPKRPLKRVAGDADGDHDGPVRMWTKQEDSALHQAVMSAKDRSLASGKMIWDMVSDVVNAVSCCYRSANHCQARWQVLSGSLRPSQATSSKSFRSSTRSITDKRTTTNAPLVNLNFRDRDPKYTGSSRMYSNIQAVLSGHLAAPRPNEEARDEHPAQEHSYCQTGKRITRITRKKQPVKYVYTVCGVPLHGEGF